jgi:predicted transcriptional regulator
MKPLRSWRNGDIRGHLRVRPRLRRRHTLPPLPLAGRGVIAEKAPGSLDELARITGKAKSNLSRTLRTMEGYGLVRLERGERGRITPKVMHDRVELDLPLTLSRKAS